MTVGLVHSSSIRPSRTRPANKPKPCDTLWQLPQRSRLIMRNIILQPKVAYGRKQSCREAPGQTPPRSFLHALLAAALLTADTPPVYLRDCDPVPEGVDPERIVWIKRLTGDRCFPIRSHSVPMAILAGGSERRSEGGDGAGRWCTVSRHRMCTLERGIRRKPG